ncbi:lysine N(6)-hydroxylase/L-ornithine N(5)-oxygenase family protein [Streptomyces sp. NRRL F-5123]|uniref:lysine N(6)-hydroxylase/L-ornithine N(5)-oxygenase family protein n=1 Tax=Streptomyces sp. NRRL F-5123 TaxID=1463856 RepID=UPI000694E449|nr:SidA/IucD/PvdA family monooxygenase [Streptomyces sp. NRRL F-5123]
MRTFDFIGIGVGPANLSLAALAHSQSELTGCFLDSKPEFAWHPGIMLPESRLNVSVFKDLATMVDPTNEFTFLNFLASTGRIYRALEANGLGCSRQEFEQYYRWAAGRLPTIRWGHTVKSLSPVGDRFEVTCDNGETFSTGTVVLGSGHNPRLPDFAVLHRGSRVLHSGEISTVAPDVRGKRVMVVGAGQSGAEVVNYLLSDDAALPAELTWVSSRTGFLPLDDSPFTNEWYAPPYVDYFYGLPAERRTQLLREQVLSSDGVSEELLHQIYKRLYHLDHVMSRPVRHRLVANRRVTGLDRDGDDVVVDLHDQDGGGRERTPADVVVFATGYESELPEYAQPLAERLLGGDGRPVVRRDYSLDWDGPAGLRIFVQNLADHTHGINDRLLSLMAWRSAHILNGIAGREVFRMHHADSTMTWHSA